MLDKIVVRGARQHNLKNISLEIPRHKLTVITGLSGSGKSSLAFDTIYAEGQRRYVESLSTFARQFLEQNGKARGGQRGRALSGDQHRAENHQPQPSFHGRHGDRNIRLHAPAVRLRSAGRTAISAASPISHQTLDQIVDLILAYPEDTRVMILAPVVRDRKGEFKKLFEKYLKKGYVRVRVDGEDA